MKVEVNENGEIVLKEVYSGVLLETNSKETLGICMRDTGFEFTYMDQRYEAKEGVVRRTAPVEGTITFYSIDGDILGTFPLPERTDHQERILIAEEKHISDWNHYTMHNSNFGMKKDDTNHVWYEIKDGKIMNEAINDQNSTHGHTRQKS